MQGTGTYVRFRININIRNNGTDNRPYRHKDTEVRTH